MRVLSDLPARSAWLWATLAVILALSWQALTVSYNYGGNWTALFGTGAKFKSPPEALADEKIFRFQDSYGYDGQSYHLIAHDPFLTRGFASSVDSPPVRYRRILVPFTAWLLAAGQDQLIDEAYIAVLLAYVFLGTWWCGRLLLIRNLDPTYSLLFLALPAVVVSLDRMTVDIAVATFSVGAVYYAMRGAWTAVWVVCMFSGLTREVGLLIPAALAGYSLFRGRIRLAAALAASAAPTFGWYLYIHSRTIFPADLGYVGVLPLKGWLTRVLNPYPYPFSPFVNSLAMVLDYAALTGMFAALLYVMLNVHRLRRTALGCMALAFALLPVFINEADVWSEAIAFGRVFSPLLAMVALDGAGTRRPIALLPLFLIAPRIGLQVGGQILGVARGMLGVD